MKKREKKVISITLLMVILLAMLLPSISLATTEEIIIKDANLKEEIKRQVDVNKDGKITQEEMKKLQIIDIPRGVTDVTGLEYAKNLEEIRVLYDKALPDLSILKLKTHSVVIVILEGELDIDIKFDFLKNVKNLHELFIAQECGPRVPNDKIDYKSITEIKGLDTLIFYGIAPSSIKELKGIKGLAHLTICSYLSDEITFDVSGIGDFTQLYDLYFDGVNMKNANEIGKLTNLSYFRLEDVKGVSDLSSALAKCNQLSWVEIHRSDLSDISFLDNKEKLEKLYITDLPIKNINDKKFLLQLISTLPKLQDLYIDLGEIKIENLKRYNEMKKSFLADETNKKNVNVENSEKTKTEDKKETKKEKPTRIPQAGMNVVANVISILVVTSVVILVIAFVKARRK